MHYIKHFDFRTDYELILGNAAMRILIKDTEQIKSKLRQICRHSPPERGESLLD